MPRAADKTDTLPGLWSRAYRRVDDGTQMGYAWYRAINLPKPVIGQSDGIHSEGLWCQFSKVHVSVPMPLSRLSGVLMDLERPEESL